jgi:CheY-like chemotaxis protein
MFAFSHKSWYNGKKTSTHSEMKKALIVDDSVYNRTLLGAILKKKDIETVAAEDGIEAVVKFKESNPDIVFLDIMMPKKNGIEALKEIKQINNKIVAIMVTSVASIEEVQHAKNAGANGYIVKPFDTEKIFSVLRKFGIIE